MSALENQIAKIVNTLEKAHKKEPRALYDATKLAAFKEKADRGG